MQPDRWRADPVKAEYSMMNCRTEHPHIVAFMQHAQEKLRSIAPA